MPTLIFRLMTLLITPFVFAIQIPVVYAGQDDAVSRKQVVLVRPIVLCDNDGQNPASSRLPKKLIDQVYSKAELEVLYLSPLNWNFGAGRRGEVDLDVIVRQGESNGTICRDPRIVNLVFVSAIDGKMNLQGRGKQNGNVCFVCLGPNPEKNDADTESFVIAHEIGHCLNLIHAIDDPNVPDDVANLQGEGEMKDRLAADALHDSQRDTIMKSPLFNKRIRFFTKAEAEKELIDESWEPYLSQANESMVRYTLGLPTNEPIPGDPVVRLEFLRQRVTELASEFTDEEKEFLTSSVEQINDVVGDKWPMISRFPWNFVKVDPRFYNSKTHTRGLTIFIRAGGIAYMKQSSLQAIWLLAHEKVHILQRTNGHVFYPFYNDLGYQRIELNQESAEKLVLKQNTDAFTNRWAFPVDDSLHFYATTFEKTADHKFKKTPLLVPLGQSSDGTFTALPAIDMDRMRPWKSRFLLMESAYEDPNELTAYVAIHLISRWLNRPQPTPANPELLDRSEHFFKQCFAIVKDD